MSGWIKIYRNILDDPSYFDVKFDRIRCWIDLLLIAEIKPRQFRVRGNVVKLERGDVGISIRKLSERWKLSINTVQERLKEFERNERIEVIHRNTINLIRILNYAKYQDNQAVMMSENCMTDTQNDTQTDTQIDTQTDTQTDTPYKKYKEDKEEKEDNVVIPYVITTSSKKKFLDVESDENVEGNSVSESKICKDVREYFNTKVLENNSAMPKIRGKLIGTRAGLVNARIKEHGEQAVREVIDIATKNDFLNGRKTQFRADFKWIMLPENFKKVWEGNYDRDRDNATQVITRYNNFDNGNNGNFRDSQQAQKDRLEREAIELVKYYTTPKPKSERDKKSVWDIPRVHREL